VGLCSASVANYVLQLLLKCCRQRVCCPRGNGGLCLQCRTSTVGIMSIEQPCDVQRTQRRKKSINSGNLSPPHCRACFLQVKSEEPTGPAPCLCLQCYTQPTKPLHRKPRCPGATPTSLQQHHSSPTGPAAARPGPLPAVQADLEAGGLEAGGFGPPAAR